MNIKTLCDAVLIVEFIRAHQGKSVEEAIELAAVPMHLREQLKGYFAPPLDIIAPDQILNKQENLPKCDPQHDSSQQYYGALEKYLIDVKGRPKSTVGSLAESSLQTIRRFPKPNGADAFQVRGLVLGHIQSGKTANMAALIARAADEGYKLIIVLGGFWKDLRSQTQTRLDQEITGYSDEPAEGPYVVHDSGLPKWVRLTGSGLDRDFTPGPNDLNPSTPKLAVIKKNQKIEHLTNWLKKSPVPLSDLPALIIDDEADQGSIDTNYGKTDDDGEPIDPSATNRRIRALLKALPKSVYVGYTATPFANVLIDSNADDDLYPRDFIISLPEPAGYFGPRRLFGLGLDPSDLSPAAQEKPALNVIRHVKDEDLQQIDSALARQSNECPDVLQKALISFLLSCCGRMARGQEKNHFSMLVHPSPKTDPHRIFASAIEIELNLLKNAASFPKKFPNVMSQAREMWEKDFMHVTVEQKDATMPVQDFEIVWKFAKSVLEETEIKVLNIHSDDRLDYTGSPKRYIVVGGNKLSRGLTLEGLSVSVFTRSANQYDTLLQMGRWFGYRPGYADLTRIYVDPDMADRFAELARVEDELRADLRKYAQEPDPPTPMDLKPIIRSHPTLAITARSKMGAGKPMNLSFQNTMSETISFPVARKDYLEKNINATKALIATLSETAMRDTLKGTFLWRDIPASKILDYIGSYEFSKDARDVNRINLMNYISRQNTKGELTHWDVILPHGNKENEPYTWSQDVITHKIRRSPLTPSSIRQLKSPSDINFWRTNSGRDEKDPKYGALVLYLVDKKSESESGLKFAMEGPNSEDLLGMVLVFPESKSNATIEYVSQ